MMLRLKTRLMRSTIEVNTGAKWVVARIMLTLTFLLLLGNITADQLRAQTPPDEPEEYMLCATYTNPVNLPVNLVKGPVSFGLSELPTEVNACFQFTAPLPVSGVEVKPTITSASLVFGDADLTVADLFVTDDDVSAYPNFTFRVDAAGEIDLLQYAFAPVNTLSAVEGVVLNSVFELNITGTTDPEGEGEGEDFHYRYSTSSQTLTQVNVPPIPDAGVNVTIDSSEQTITTLNGTASDADGDPLTYRWLEGATQLLPSTPVVGGVAPLELSFLSTLSFGVHTLTLEVNDGVNIAVSDDMILTINNSPPTVAPSGGGTFQLGDNITLSGSVSDFDGDVLDYRWFEGASDFTTSFIGTTAGGTPVLLPNFFIIGGLPLGNHLITLEADDGTNLPVSYDIIVNVIDTALPTISATVSPGILWPPNHKMVDVVIQANANDNSGTVTLTASVVSSEPPDTDGDGNTIPDYTTPVIDQLTGVITLQLRAERKGNGSGRTYTITVTATDGEGNRSYAIVEVVAPHGSGKKTDDDGIDPVPCPPNCPI